MFNLKRCQHTLLSRSARLEASRSYLSLSRRLRMILLIRKIQPSIRGHSYFILLLPVPAAHTSFFPWSDATLACARHHPPPDGGPRPNAGACTRRGEAAGHAPVEAVRSSEQRPFSLAGKPPSQLPTPSATARASTTKLQTRTSRCSVQAEASSDKPGF